MAIVRFTANLRRHVRCDEIAINGPDLIGVLHALFDQRPDLKHYIVDDAFRLRPHVAVFVDGERVVDRILLAESVGKNSEIYIMQALSGG